MLLVNGAKVKGDILRTLHFLNGTTSAFQRPLRGVTATTPSLLPLSGRSGHGRTCCSLHPVANDPFETIERAMRPIPQAREIW